ncbi:MAG: YdbL family protein [Desulfopila sp.]|jgi:uncharacterized protein YdbL (DUF1318 family)|nr:YdbL family protein [Desulfopila sp.]
MNLFRYSFFMVLVSCVFLLAPAAQAASVKERMAARIPAITVLKDQGLVGENNMGFLEYRTAARPEEKMITEENRDRKAVYEAIGKNQGAPAELVGQRRAKMIVENGKAGHWYQKPGGEWYKK